MYHEIPGDLLAVIEPVANAHGLEIVDAGQKAGAGRTTIRVFLDTPQGDGAVTIDACAAVHREIGTGLLAAGWSRENLALEVSSPGVDRVLGRAVDFERAVGRQVSLETHQALAGRKRFKGELVAFAEQRARVRQDQTDFEIPFEQIRRGVALYPFEPLGARR